MKIGLEIHQQLDTRKLFCSCDSKLISEEPMTIVQRRFKAVSGELGKRDVAAKFEESTDRQVYYEFYPNHQCLVELDEEPPHPMNEKALEISLKLARMLNMKVLPEIHIMRKTVVDGSNTSGFQRTALVAVDGYIRTSLGKVGIETLHIEEESARKTRDEGNNVYYKLDRLGIPLVEIATSADIKNPEHAKETALKIGALLRTLQVKRGIGTIRQDVNVSIPKGTRVEIKGVQDVRNLPKTITIETKRQKSIVNLKKDLDKRKAKKSEFMPIEITDILLTSESNLKKLLGKAYAVKLNDFNELIKKGGDYRVGRDFADIAKKFGLKGIIHSDELPGYGFSLKDKRKIMKALGCKINDAFIFTISKNPDVLEYIVYRANQYLSGVPKDVRRSNPEGTTSYLRPLPGKARMYPETDLYPIIIDKNLLKSKLPETPDKTKKRYVKMGLGSEQANQILSSHKKRLFEEFSESFKIKPSIIASVLLSSESLISKKYGSKPEIKKEYYEKAFKLLEKGKIGKNDVPDALHSFSKGKKYDAIKEMSDSELKKVVKNIILENKEIKDIKRLVGYVLIKTKNRANPKKVVSILKDILN